MAWTEGEREGKRGNKRERERTQEIDRDVERKKELIKLHERDRQLSLNQSGDR